MADIAGGPSTTAVLPAAGGYATSDIEANGDADWFAVQLLQGVQYRFFVQGSQQATGATPGGTLVDPALVVLDAGGIALTSRRDGLGRNELIDFTAPATGVYYLSVTSQTPGGLGTYTVSVRPYATEADFAAYLTTGFWQYMVTTPNHATDPIGTRKFAQDVVTVNISDLTPSEKSLALLALDLFHQVSRLNFTVVEGAADITYTNDGVQHAEGGSHPSQIVDGTIRSAFVRISSDLAAGEFPQGLSTYIHETAHALGLGHSGPYNGGDAQLGVTNLVANDTRQYSLMSYFGFPGQPLSSLVVTPQIMDVRAIQDLYGDNTSTRSGDTIYGFGSTAGELFDFTRYPQGVAFTIYDAGGLDTLDASGFSQPQVIDLHSAAFSSIGGFRNNIGIFTTTVLEVGIGGAGNDALIGNDAGNQLYGRSGGDTISGGSGPNYLRGDEGNDSIVGGAGFDDINGNMGGDTADGGLGNDWVVGGKDGDAIHGGPGGDLVYGNLGADTCDGGPGDDIVRGGQESDSVSGGAGNDYVSGDRGNDTLSGGAGADQFHTFGEADIDRVLDFSPTEGDQVRLDAGTQYVVSQVGADTVIDMTGGGTMILVAVSMTALSANWIFVG